VHACTVLFNCLQPPSFKAIGLMISTVNR
jgi:hypothetical protein